MKIDLLSKIDYTAGQLIGIVVNKCHQINER